MTEVVGTCGTAAGVAAGRGRGGRNGFLVTAERRVLLDDESGTLRVMPSARLDPCVCDDDGGNADINEVEAVAVVAAVDVPCRGSDSAIGTGDPAVRFDGHRPSPCAAEGSEVGAGMGGG